MTKKLLWVVCSKLVLLPGWYLRTNDKIRPTLCEACLVIAAAFVNSYMRKNVSIESTLLAD